MLVIHARVPLDPDAREHALQMVERLADRTRAEAGAIDYRATTEVGEPNVVHFFERYEDEAAWDAHGETDHYAAFERALPQIADGEITVERYDVDGEPEVFRFEPGA